MYDPYQQPPPSYPPPPQGFDPNGYPPSQYDAPLPQVVMWYRIFCGCMTLMYLMATAMMILMLVAPSLDPQLNTPEMAEVRVLGVFYIVMFVPLSILHLVGIFAPRKPWGWYYGMVVLVANLVLNWCCIPFVIPLLIFWLKDEPKMYFRVQ